MSLDDTLRALLAEAGKPARLREARAAWVRRTAAAWREAQRQMDERLCDAEEAKVGAFRAPLKAVAERDMWPKTLYWGRL
ncbi:MAG: hypothetical protein ACJ8FS_09550 [Sphingomicrobium sp.]